nr:bifunctional alpha,alpha-trehalose-phosphate synthase (UDP-forming)/trehalose-phosphatase [Luteitalea sp. TBR-22]
MLVVANRLPVTARAHKDGVRLAMSSGGLATGLRNWQERAGAIWIGWPGDVSRFSPAQLADLDRQLDRSGVVPVHLTADEIATYYEGFANQVLWPLCHYLVDRVPVDATGWRTYCDVNARFADAVCQAWRPGDLVWVHDYQLMLVPSLIRERLPEARIGYFHHIPFPSSEVLRILPWRQEVLRGLLGADVIGFHTFAYRRHFLTSLLDTEGLEAEVDTLEVGGRTVHTGVFPMGIDAAHFEALAREPETQAVVARLREEAAGRHIVLGVDRLDYTKGIPRRLLAFERLLERRPDLRDRVRYVQVAVPSREGVDAYRSFRRQVDELVGRVNGRFTTLGAVPVHYLHRSVTQRELVGLFGAADVMLVTPLRDGMNLVAKEFVAARPDGDGVLVLSEFAGAAAELGDALIVNPYDVDALSDCIERALTMPDTERRLRMANLRARVRRHDVHAWASGYLGALTQATAVATDAGDRPVDGEAALLAAVTVAEPQRWCLLLDYDGTLTPIVERPELATPNDDLLDLLRELAGAAEVDVHLVSGRPRDTLERWLGSLPVDLWAEHGFWHRPARQSRWESATAVPEDWWVKVLPILESFAATTPGTRVEQKSAALAWHYRGADPAFGERQAHELRLVLGDALSNQPLEVVEGKKVVEIRLRGVSKAAAARHVRRRHGPTRQVIAVGDDRTDEDLFQALPDGITVKVGPGATAARYRLDDVPAVHRVLRSLLTTWARAVP